LIGALAFSISLVRDRLYGQDYSDVQYVAATLTDTTGGGGSAVGVDGGAPSVLQLPAAAETTT
jgi:hypothetical protein